MNHLPLNTLRMLAISFIASLTLFACSKDDDDDEIDPIEKMIQEIRETTAPYHDVNNAIAAGWSEEMSPCVEHPTEGGMGFHYGRMEFMDGRKNHLEPQVLLYGPDGSGGLEFLGVEYIIPFAIHSADSAAPVILGQHYHQNPNLEIWALHVWTEKENPKGMFYDWNPEVSCD